MVPNHDVVKSIYSYNITCVAVLHVMVRSALPDMPAGARSSTQGRVRTYWAKCVTLPVMLLYLYRHIYTSIMGCNILLLDI